jgi:hypothetical protein
MFTLRFSHVRDLPTFVWPNEGTSCSSKRSKIDQKNENTPAEQMPLLKQQEEVTWKKKNTHNPCHRFSSNKCSANVVGLCNVSLNVGEIASAGHGSCQDSRHFKTFQKFMEAETSI